MSKKKIIIILSILVIVVAIISLYGTFATNSTVDATSSATYGVTLTNSTSEVTMPASSSKTIYYKLSNTNKGTVKYGVAYSGTNITVKIYSDSNDPETGLINYGENKFIKLYIQNTSTTDSTATITTILGYENGGDLIVPTGKTLVTEKYPTLALYIKNKFSKNTTAVNNNITYDLDSNNKLMKDTQGNIRYYGATPNNYIDIGDTDSVGNPILYRIIGVFDNKVKIIRNESIGLYSWDTSASNVNSGCGINEWSQADLMKLLNPGYESNSVGGSLWYNSGSGNCYNATNNSTTTCNFTSSGLSENVKSKIADTLWNLGGGDYAGYANEMFNCEISNNVINSPSDGITRTTSWNGKIALMSPSDYGYAVDLTQCDKDLYSYNYGVCKNNNWLFSDEEWLLNPHTNSPEGVYFIYYDGSVIWDAYLEMISASEPINVRPAFYLNENITITSGAGTAQRPYVIN